MENTDGVNNQKIMKAFAGKMSFCMGIIMSFCLTCVNMAHSGVLSLGSFLINFVLSLVIATMIGRFVDIGVLPINILRKHNIDPSSVKGRILKAFISDLIYTPLMTIIMASIGYYTAIFHGARISYFPMIIQSLLISFFVAFLVILFISPLLEKFLLKKVMMENERN